MMRYFLGAVFSAATLWSQSNALERAEKELERLRALVEAGALAPARLAAAQEEVADARDEVVLSRTLYGRVAIEELSEEQGREMTGAARRRLERQEKKLAEARRLIDEGVLAPRSLTDLEAEAVRRKQTLDAATERSRLLAEIVEIARAEALAAEARAAEPTVTSRPVVERFDGDGEFKTADQKALVLAYEKEFGKPLPVSARGDTRVHRAMGFDHTGRIDVALNPDQSEGVWLRKYLQENGIPYFAFRLAVEGSATGPHIHVGPGSTRVRAD